VDVDGALLGESAPGAGSGNALPHRTPAPESGGGPLHATGLGGVGDAAVAARSRDPDDRSRLLAAFRWGVARGRVAHTTQPDNTDYPDRLPEPPDRAPDLRQRSDDVVPPERPTP
jgi:hypothetical protein